MSLDSSWPLQVAVVTALKADAGVTALIGQRVYDYVPEDDVSYPFVSLGDDTVEDDGTKSFDMAEIHFTVHAWDTGDRNAASGGYRGRKRVKQILDAVAAVLHHGSLTLTGHTLVEMHLSYGEIAQEPDGLTFHGVHRYRALTQPTS